MAGKDARPSVPSMGRVYRVGRYPTQPMEVSVARPQGVSREVKLKKAGSKLSTVGTRTGSEAGCERRAG